MCVETAGVEDHWLGSVGRPVNQVDQLGFAVALPHKGFQPEVRGRLLDERDELEIGGAAVHVRLAQSQPVEVGAIQHVDCRHGFSTSA